MKRMRTAVGAVVVTALAATLSPVGWNAVRAQASGSQWIHPFGNAADHGEPAPVPREAVAIESGPGGLGYWIAAADGSVFGFGGVGYFGSMGAHRLRAPIADMASTPSGAGYWLAGADGSVFGFGDAPYAGSMGGQRFSHRLPRSRPLRRAAGTCWPRSTGASSASATRSTPAPWGANPWGHPSSIW